MNSNIIFLVQPGGEIYIYTPEQFKYKGLTVSIEGEGNTVKLYEPLNLSDSRISINANECYVEIGSSVRLVSFKVEMKNGDAQTLIVGSDFSCGSATFLMSDPMGRLKIGKDCMFSSGITIMIGDSHQIYALDAPNVCKNWSSGVEIGNHVWVGRGVEITSNASVADNSIIAFGSLVTRRFKDQNVSIGGSPAEVISHNIGWNRKAPNIKHVEKMKKYTAGGYTLTEEEFAARLNQDEDTKWKQIAIENYHKKRSELFNEIDFIKDAIKKNNHLSFVFVLCKLMLKVGKYDEAIELCNYTLTENNNPEIHLFKGIALKNMNLVDDAEAVVESMLRSGFEPNAEQLELFFEIIEESTSGKWIRFLDSLPVIQVINTSDTLKKLYFYYLMEASMPERASEIGIEIMENKLDRRFLVDLNPALISCGKIDHSERFCASLLQINRNSLWLHTNIIEAKKINKKYSEALALCEEALREFPANIYIVRKQIYILIDAGRKEEAQALLTNNLKDKIDEDWSLSRLKTLMPAGVHNV